MQVPVIGQGTWNMEGSREAERSAVAALKAGLDLGMTHIDTAEMYGGGRAEELVADAIDGRRSEVFLVSKVLPSNASYRGTLRACESSLKRLRTDRLDLYLLHWPSSYPLEETMRALEQLVAEGKTRFMGVSNFDTAQVQEAEKAVARERLASDQVLYHLGERGIEWKLLPYLISGQIPVVAYSPFGHSRFPRPDSKGGRVLADVGRKYGRTARQVVLNFLTRNPGVFTIPKSSNVAHTRENAGGAGWEMEPSDITAIDRAFPSPDHDVPLGIL